MSEYDPVRRRASRAPAIAISLVSLVGIGGVASVVVPAAAQHTMEYLADAQPGNQITAEPEEQYACSFKVSRYGTYGMGVADFEEALAQAGDDDHRGPFLQELTRDELGERGLPLSGLGRESRSDRWVFKDVEPDACLEAHRRLETVDMPNYNFGGEGDDQTFMPHHSQTSTPA